MEQLFRTNGKLVILYSRNPLIFSIDDKYYTRLYEAHEYLWVVHDTSM